MDATRLRRTRDPARRGWYAHWRCVRFARHLGFPPASAVVLEALPEPAAPGELFFEAARLGVRVWFLWASLPWRCSGPLFGCQQAA